MMGGTAAALGLLHAALAPTGAWASAPDTQSVLLAWRDAQGRDHVGVWLLEWTLGRMSLRMDVPVPSRPHGFAIDGQGGWLAVAGRTGQWLLSVDAEGRHQWHREASPRRFNGHVAYTDGAVFTTETDPSDDQAYLVRRRPDTLVAERVWPVQGRDAHQFTAAPDGSLLVCVGGIARGADGNKRRGLPVQSALLQLDARDGEPMGRWALSDPQVSVRHLAWSSSAEPRLGLALQAEHADPQSRSNAPLLALWSPQGLEVPLQGGDEHGYAGDLCAAPGGGFVVSAQKGGRALLWHPDARQRWVTVAALTEPCGLSAWRGTDDRVGVLIVAGRGVARWHAGGAQMIAWPQAMVPDNHAMVLPA